MLDDVCGVFDGDVVCEVFWRDVFDGELFEAGDVVFAVFWLLRVGE